MRTVKIASAIIACAIQAYGAATVTASRDYVDRKTTLHPYSNEVEQVGYVLGTQTNKVLASKEYVDDSISASSPGDYQNVSNNAYMASSDTLKRLFSVAAYPAWEKSRQSSGNYTAGDIVSYSGMVYRCISTPSGTDAPDEYSSKWEVKTIGDLIAENTPGDYSNVSNNAYGALQKVDTTNTVNSIITNSSSGVLSMAFAYPLARFDYFNMNYPPNGSIVEKDGRLYRAKNDGYGDGSPWFPVDDTYYFEDVTEEMGTNALVRLSTLNMKKNDRITDEVNTIFADRKVYFQPMATNYYNRLTGPLSLTTINETNGVVTAADWGDGVQDGIGIFWMGGTWFLRQGQNTTSMTNGTPNDETVELGNYRFVRKIVPNGSPVYVGKLALTNDIDYTSSNTQLVATIEATAPAPGNYAAVSNAAMNARSLTDLCVRGVPQGEGSWFTVDNSIYSWTQSGNWHFIENPEGNYIEPYEDGFRLHGAGLVTEKFVLNSQYEANPELFNDEYLSIIGYTNTLAQVSQIPTVPSGLVTTNEEGIIKSSISIWNLDKENNPHDTTLRIGGNGDPFGVSNRIVVAGSYYGGSILLQHGGPEGSDIVISASGNDGASVTSQVEISVGGTNILPLVFGSSPSIDTNYNDSAFVKDDGTIYYKVMEGVWSTVNGTSYLDGARLYVYSYGATTNWTWYVAGGTQSSYRTTEAPLDATELTFRYSAATTNKFYRGSHVARLGMVSKMIETNVVSLVTNIHADVRVEGSFSQGTNTTASGAYSHAEGDRTIASGKASHAEGVVTRANAEASHASGVNVFVTQRATFGAGVSVNGTNSASFVWSGQETSPWYGTHGKGTFNIDPIGGLNGMWIGNQTFQQAILSQLADTSRTNTVTRIIDGSGGESTVTNEIPTIRTGVEAVIGSVMDERGIPTGNTITQVVQAVVSVTSRYMWDEGDQCLYRWDMDYGFTYLTPVTNVNALLPENAHILKYLDEHKEEEQ